MASHTPKPGDTVKIDGEWFEWGDVVRRFRIRQDEVPRPFRVVHNGHGFYVYLHGDVFSGPYEDQTAANRMCRIYNAAGEEEFPADDPLNDHEARLREIESHLNIPRPNQPRTRPRS